MFKKIVVFGSSGAIGRALCTNLSKNYPSSEIFAFSRAFQHLNLKNVFEHEVDYKDENSLKISSEISSQNGDIDLVIVAIGILHNSNFMPEKAISQLSFEKFYTTFEVNTIFPAMIGKYFIPKLNKNKKSVFAALSARVGSISDNMIGGWYSYRSSKSALNMIIKNFSIEIKRNNKNAIIVGLHPGTVASSLSKPFQGNVEKSKLFKPEYAATNLISVLEELSKNSSGKCFAWDGKEIFP